MRIFNGERLQRIMSTLKVPDDEPIAARMVTRAIEGAQRKVEGHNFDIRKHLLEYDDVMNQQRTSIYNLRREVLERKDVERTTLDMLGDVTSVILDNFADTETKPEDWDFAGLNTALTQQFGIQLVFKDERLTADQLTDIVSQAVKNAYDRQKQTLGDFFSQIQKMVLLETIDVKWKEHLAQVDQLKEGINLRAYAQKDPLIEYKKEAFRAFEIVNHLIRTEAIEKIMKVQIVSENQAREQMSREESDNGYDYQGGEEAESFVPGMMPQGSAPEQSLEHGGSPEGGPSLNRAERRRQARLARKKRGRGR